MGLTNQEKIELRDDIRDMVVAGKDLKAIIKRMTGFGYKEATVRKYYRRINQE